MGPYRIYYYPWPSKSSFQHWCSKFKAKPYNAVWAHSKQGFPAETLMTLSVNTLDAALDAELN